MIRNFNSDTCDLCNSPTTVNDLKGIVVCSHCGVIKEDRFVNQSSEYRYFNDDSSGRADPRRVGNSVNLHMDSQIDLVEIDNGRNNYMTYAVQSNADKTYTRAIKLIKKYCGLLDLERLQKPAEEIYFEIKDKPEIKGKRLETVIAAVIYLAGKRTRVYIHMTTLEPVADVSHKKIMKACNVIMKLIPRINERSHEYVKQFSAKLKIPREVVIELEKICQEIERWDIFEKRLPKHRTIAAAVLYFYATTVKPELNLSLQDIKIASNVSADNTIKKYVSYIMEKKDILLSKALGDDYDNNTQ